MQISLKWINELVSIETVNLDDLIEKLTLGGFEVEEILELEIDNQNQVVLDISATANRSDSLSIQGISAEIAALLNKPIRAVTYSTKTLTWKQQIVDQSFIHQNQNDYSTFLSIIVENVSNITVPNWIQQKLISSDFIPLNNLLDFQNYILLETGYPFAFYDFDKLCKTFNQSKFNLSLSEAKNDQEFIASNNVNYQLNDSILIVKANELPISIAGIIEHQNFAYTQTTNSLLIEASIFPASKIRQQSRDLGLRTDRSARYEKALKNTYLIEALYRLITLLRIYNPKLICKLHTINQISEQIAKPISLRYETINEILGPVKKVITNGLNYISTDLISSYLDRLNFNFIYNDSKLTWEVEIPHSRSDDITREIDLIEEIGRLHGFNNFLTKLPKIKTIGYKDSFYQIRKKITTCLLNLGFNELIHYSLVNEETFLKNEISLINPLLSDCSSLRTSLLPNLIKTVQENLKQGNLFIEGFEYGHVFSGDVKSIFYEKENIAGIFGGIKTKSVWSESEKPLNWFEAKGKIEKLLKRLNLVTHWQTSLFGQINPVLHPYRSAELSLSNGKILGIFGQINPILANRLIISRDIYLFEFDLEVMQNQIQTNKLTVYKEYSLYPKIVKDLSFVVKQDIAFNTLQKTLYCNGTNFLTEINLLDEYRGSSIPKECTSLCLQLTFQSNEKTLQNKEIESIINDLKSVLIQKFDALIRE